MLKLWRHDYGTVIAIGIESIDNNRIEIEHTFYSFWNHGATNGELHWLTEKFAYFWTGPQALLKSLINAALFELLGIESHKSKGKAGGLMREAESLARTKLDSIEYLPFLGYGAHHEGAGHYYSLGVEEGDTVFTPPPRID
jgi:hypothetical protein